MKVTAISGTPTVDFQTGDGTISHLEMDVPLAVQLQPVYDLINTKADTTALNAHTDTTLANGAHPDSTAVVASIDSNTTFRLNSTVNFATNANIVTGNQSNDIVQLIIHANNQTNINNSVSSALNLFTNQFNSTTSYVNDIAIGITNRIVDATNSLWITVTNLNTTTANSTTNYINSVANDTTNRIINATNDLWIATTNLNTTTSIGITNYINSVAIDITNRIIDATNSLWTATTNLNTKTAIDTTNYINSVANNTTNTIITATNDLWVAITNLNTVTAINTTNYINSVAIGLTNRIVDSTNSLWTAVTNLNTSTAMNTTNYINLVAVTNKGITIQAGNNITLNGDTSPIQLTNGILVSIASTATGSGDTSGITNYINSVANNTTNRIINATNDLWIATTNLNASTVPTSRTITIDGTTYDLSANRSWTTAAGGVTLEQVTNVAIIVVTQYMDAAFNSRTTLYNTTGSVEVANSASFIIPLLYSPVELVDCRFYLGTTNGAPISRRATVRISQKPYNRCSDLAYLYTNQLYYSILNNLVGNPNEYTNVVADASGFIINDMYTKPTTSTQTWQTVSNYTSTVVSWNCSNIVSEAVGTLISHVNRWKLGTYMDKTGSTNLYVNITWNTPYSNVVSYSIDYLRK
jgi:hypothetical protein